MKIKNFALKILFVTVVSSLTMCEKELTLEKSQSSLPENRTTYEFDVNGLSETEISDNITDFINDYDNETISTMSGDEATWLIEALLNEQLGNRTAVEVLYTGSFSIDVTTSEDFTGSQIEGYTDEMLTQLDNIIQEIELDSGTAEYGVIDLVLEDAKINVDYLITRGFYGNYGASGWLCHSAQEYPWSSTILTNGNGQQVMWPDFYCANASYDNYGVNHFMAARLNSHFRGYECKEYSQEDPIPVPCDKSNRTSIQ